MVHYSYQAGRPAGSGPGDAVFRCRAVRACLFGGEEYVLLYVYQENGRALFLPCLLAVLPH
jgi:hypothetical protein